MVLLPGKVYLFKLINILGIVLFWFYCDNWNKNNIST
jgi:hypothetical protein